MKIETSFVALAAPDRVYEYLLDVDRVVGCVPGAELSEVVGTDTYRGRVRVRVGPVTVSYQGTAQITDRDAMTRSAILAAEGKETKGSGSARATTAIAVQEEGAGSKVTLVTDLTITGRVAQFGRGMIEDVARSIVEQMGACIQAHLESPAGPAEAVDGRVPAAAESGVPEPVPAAPLDAVALARSLAGTRLRKLRDQPTVLAALGGVIVVLMLLLCWRRYRR